MSNISDAENRSTAFAPTRKGQIPKDRIIYPNKFPNNTWMFFRLLRTGIVGERFVHWVKLPHITKSIPVPCFCTAAEHAAAKSWTIADKCPMCKWAVDKDPRHDRNTFNKENPNINHQWLFKVNQCNVTRDSAGKITSMSVSPKVDLLQLTQAGLFKAIIDAGKDPELPSNVPLNTRALKIFKALEAGKEAKDVEYRAAYSAATLQNVPTQFDDPIPSEEDLEKPFTDELFKELNTPREATAGAATAAAGQQGPSGAAGAAPAAGDSEF